MSTANKFAACLSANQATVDAYLDTAMELSKIDRKNHHQVTEKGVPLVYDMMVTISTPSEYPDGTVGSTSQTTLTGAVKTAPNNWQTRNAVRMAHFTREDLRKEAGVSKGAIGKYAKTLRMNLDAQMFDIAVRPTTNVDPASARYQRFYAAFDLRLNALSAGSAGGNFVGGVWDYTQLAQVENDDANTADPFYINVAGAHNTVAPGPYDYVSALQAYNQRRQTTLDDSTVTSGGDTQFINNESPFFRVPQQDVSEDAYVDITLDEQDNPPYDRAVSNSSDFGRTQIAEYFQLTSQMSQVSFRVQAPLGLLHFNLADMWATGAASQGGADWAEPQQIVLEVEVLGTYEM
jgi:hypothetical protein